MKSKEIYVPLVILTCDTIFEGIKESVLVSCGTPLGYKNGSVVYASIDGWIKGCIKRRECFDQWVYDIEIQRYKHGLQLWTHIPYLKDAGGRFFLYQLGIQPACADYADVIYINGLGEERSGLPDMYLLMTETERIVLGADALAYCMNAHKVIFLIDRQWHIAEYLLKKYIHKYRSMMKRGIVCEVKGIENQYPVKIKHEYMQVMFDVQTAMSAYTGRYEHSPEFSHYISVKIFQNNPMILKIPVGAVIRDVLVAAGMEKGQFNENRLVLGGLMQGSAVSAETPVGITVSQLHVIDQLNVPELTMNMEQCIGCHLCERICPYGLIPFRLTKNTIRQCVHCNLCSYICPSKISLGERIKRADGFEDFGSVRKNKRKKHAEYIALSSKHQIPLVQIQSDASPHIHSGNSLISTYLVWVLSIFLPLSLKVYVQGLQSLGNVCFLSFFFMAFHMILSGFCPEFFLYSHPLKGILDGLIMGLILPYGLPPIMMLFIVFCVSSSEKLFEKYGINMNALAVLAALVFQMGNTYERPRFYMNKYAYVAMLLMMMALLILSYYGYVYIVPVVIDVVFMVMVMHVNVVESMMMALFFGQRLMHDVIPYDQQFKVLIMQMVMALTGRIILVPEASVALAIAGSQMLFRGLDILLK